MMNVLGWIFLIFVTLSLLYVTVMTALAKNTRTTSRLGKGSLAILWLVTLIVLTIRFVGGLGAVTNMTDKFPWGVWIGLLQSGVALAAGGFVVAATVHIFHIRRFEALLRPMVLMAFLGYTFVALTLFIEVGRPYLLWHPLVMWQHTSIMFEVAWCVTLYMTVLAVEFSPVVFERMGLTKMVSILHTAAIPIVIAGVILSTLHQSSMGSMFLIIPQKMSILWFSPFLPVFFLISSVAAGLAMVIVGSNFSHRVLGKSLPKELLPDIARAAGFVLWIYFVLRVVDFIFRGAWHGMAENKFLSLSYLMEVIFGILIPAVLLLQKKVHARTRKLLGSALLVCGGVILNRLNVSWFSLTPYAGSEYFPTWMELAISLFIFTVMVVAFGLSAKFLPVFPPKEKPLSHPS